MISFIFSSFTIAFIYIQTTDIYAMKKLKKGEENHKN